MHFDTELRGEGEQGLFPVFSALVGKPVLPATLKLRASCVTGDQADGLIATDCTYRATDVTDRKIEIITSSSWSLAKHQVVAVRLRIVSTSESSVEMHSLAGQHTEGSTAMRDPAESPE